MSTKQNLVHNYEEARLEMKERFASGCPDCSIPQQRWETFEDVLYVECEYCEFTDWVFMEEKPEWERY